MFATSLFVEPLASKKRSSAFDSSRPFCLANIEAALSASLALKFTIGHYVNLAPELTITGLNGTKALDFLRSFSVSSITATASIVLDSCISCSMNSTISATPCERAAKYAKAS